MNDPERPEQESSSVEVVDLDAAEAADRQESSWAKHRVLLWQRSLTRQRVRLLSGLGLFALLAIVVLASVLQSWPLNVAALFSASSHTAPNASAPPVSSISAAKILLPQETGIVCLADAIWSPDSRLIAVAGYERTCLANGLPNGPGTLLIYDARSGRLVKHVVMDGQVLAAFHRLFPRDHRAPILDYQEVLWSPDGGRLALPFEIAFTEKTPSGIQITPAYTGIMLFDADGTHSQVFLQQQNSVFAFNEWDTLQGRQVQTSAGQSLFQTGSLPAALHWGNDGALLPGNQPQHSLNPVGNPAGGHTFTLWQPGSVAISPPYSGPGSQQLASYLFNTFFSAWSPDGRFLATITIVAYVIPRQTPAAQSPPAISSSSLLPSLSARANDQAFQHALDMITGALVPSNLVLLSWRLDGQALAVYNAGTTELDILDCATGAQTASLLLSTSIPPGQLNGPYLLRWSPDGAHLLMFDPDVGELLTWNVH